MGAHEHAGAAAGDIRIGDLDGDGGVGAGDLVRLLAAWGPCDDDGCCLADLDQGRVVDIGDLVQLHVRWRPAP